VVASAMSIAGCGGHTSIAPPTVAVKRAAHPVWCPTASVRNVPTPSSFDARLLLGRAESHAAGEASKRGCSSRVVMRDGRGLAVTADVSLRRIDFAVDRGIVTGVSVG
jgi:hypothetical protein